MLMLNFYMLSNFARFLCCVLIYLLYIYFFQNQDSFRNIIIVSNNLDPGQAQQFFGSDLGLVCLHELSTDST